MMFLETLVNSATIAAIVLTGTMAGLFFVFSTSVMPGLAVLPEKDGMKAMILFNRTILNPVFLSLFVASAAACLVSLLIVFTSSGTPRLSWHLLGCLIYLIGGFGITAGYHVPRNNRLDKLSPEKPADLTYWQQYQREWNRMNYVRAFFSALAAALMAIALLV